QNHGGRGVALRMHCAVLPTPPARKLAELGLSHLEGLKHCAPFSRSRLHCSATPQGQERRRKHGGNRLKRIQK
ncbi:MAG: hypothetical protein KC592_16280, partial [Nitrospira sp.]|nr:hypothetical protein [Nitrospira sp.]